MPPRPANPAGPNCRNRFEEVFEEISSPSLSQLAGKRASTIGVLFLIAFFRGMSWARS